MYATEEKEAWTHNLWYLILNSECNFSIGFEDNFRQKLRVLKVNDV